MFGHSLLVLGLSYLLAGAPSSETPIAESGRAVAPIQDELFSLSLDKEGMSVEDLLARYASLTGRKIVYSARMMHSRRVNGAGDWSFKRADADYVFQRILMANDLLVASVIEGGTEILYVEDMKTTQFAKSSAKFVAPRDVAARAQTRPAEIVSTTVALQNIDAEYAQRLLANYIADHRLGFCYSVADANAIVIVNFPSTAQQMLSVLESLEAAAKTDAAEMWRKYRQEKREEAGKK